MTYGPVTLVTLKNGILFTSDNVLPIYSTCDRYSSTLSVHAKKVVLISIFGFQYVETADDLRS